MKSLTGFLTVVLLGAGAAAAPVGLVVLEPSVTKAPPFENRRRGLSERWATSGP